MAETLEAPAPDQPEIDRLFGDPAFRELGQHGGPALLFSAADTSLAWANAAARRQFGPKLDALPSRLAGAGSMAGSAPRLRRLLIETGAGMAQLSFLAKRASLADGREVIIAALLGAATVDAPAPISEN